MDALSTSAAEDEEADPTRRWLACIVFLTVLTRLGLGLAVDPSHVVTPDSAEYLGLASKMASGEGYVLAGEPHFFRPPGYPTILAILTALFGDLRVVMVLVLQALADGLNVWLLALLCRRVFPQISPLPAAVLHLLSSTSLVYAAKVLSETFFTTVLLLFLLALVRVERRWQWQLLLLPLLMGMMLYLRTIAMPLSVCLGGWLLVTRNWRAALCLVLGVGLLAAPWIARNKQAGFDGFSSNGAITLYRYHAAALQAELAFRSFSLQQEINTMKLNELSAAEQGEFASREWKRVIAEAPIHYAWLHVRKSPMLLLPIEGELARMLGVRVGGNGTMAVINSAGFIAGIRHFFEGKLWLLFVLMPAIGMLVAKFVLATGGFVMALRQRELLLMNGAVVVICGLCLGILGPDAHPRFRVPVEPLISLYGGFAVCWLANRRRKESPNAADS